MSQSLFKFSPPVALLSNLGPFGQMVTAFQIVPVLAGSTAAAGTVFMHLREFRLSIHLAEKSSLQPYCLYATSHQESSPPKGPVATIFLSCFSPVTNPLLAGQLAALASGSLARNPLSFESLTIRDAFLLMLITAFTRHTGVKKKVFFLLSHSVSSWFALVVNERQPRCLIRLFPSISTVRPQPLRVTFSLRSVNSFLFPLTSLLAVCR